MLTIFANFVVPIYPNTSVTRTILVPSLPPSASLGTWPFKIERVKSTFAVFCSKKVSNNKEDIVSASLGDIPPSKIAISTRKTSKVSASSGSNFDILPSYSTATRILVDKEVIHAMQSLYAALHDPSVLDATRHRRFGLAPSSITHADGKVNVLRSSTYACIEAMLPMQAHTIHPSEQVHPQARLQANATRFVDAPQPSSAYASPSLCADLDRPLLPTVLPSSPPLVPLCLRDEGISSARMRRSGGGIQVPLHVLPLDTPDASLSRSELDSFQSLARLATSTSREVSSLPSIQLNNHSDASLLTRQIPLPDAPSRLIATATRQYASVHPSMDFEILRFLGEGTSGTVYYAHERLTATKVALKVVPKANKNAYTLSVLLQERQICAKEGVARSPWFVDLWAAWHDRENMYFAMSFYPTDLDSEMMRCEIMDPVRARFYMAEIIIALTELHSLGIIHRDVKAPNILIDHEGHVVLADFGLSKDFRHKPTIAERVYQPYWPYLRLDDVNADAEQRDPRELCFVAWDYRGSELEMAPEIHKGEPYSFGVDFWSAAVVLYWMLTGRPPFYEDEDEYENETDDDVKSLRSKVVENPLYWDPEDVVDDVARDFLEKMLTKEPGKRLMISYQMPNHPYFAGINWSLMEERRVPPPWVPTLEVGHLYQPTSPSFTPGAAFTPPEADDLPEFNYASPEAWDAFLHAVHDPENDVSRLSDSTHSSSESSPEPSSTDAVYSAFGDCAGDRDPSVSSKLTAAIELELDFHLYSLDSIDIDVGDKWDRSFVNPPSTKPCGPGPRAWLSALDLKYTMNMNAPASGSSSSGMMSTLPTCYDITPPPSALQQNYHPYPHFATQSAPTLHKTHRGQDCPAAANANGGFLSKIKSWIGKVKKSRKDVRDGCDAMDAVAG